LLESRYLVVRQTTRWRHLQIGVRVANRADHQARVGLPFDKGWPRIATAANSIPIIEP
jgi:hypothetical protein